MNIYDNPHIRGITAEPLRWMFTDMHYIPRYMPWGWRSLAAEPFRGVIQLNATNAAAQHNLSLTLAKLGQEDAARASLAEAARLQAR